MTDWRQDRGRPAYDLPLIVDTPRGKEDISVWARNNLRFECWLALRSGGSEWNAKIFVPDNVLYSLEHGKTYTREQLAINPGWQGTAMNLPEKLQFLVEKL